MPRLFSAIEIPRSVAERLTLLRSGLTGARWIDPEKYHLTFRFIGVVDGATARDFESALGEIVAGPFELEVTGLGSFGGDKPRAIFAGIGRSQGLETLQRANERAAREAGLPPEGRNYKPHVTLARLKGARAELAQDYFQLRALDAQKQLLTETVVAYQKTLDLTNNRYNSGVASR